MGRFVDYQKGIWDDGEDNEVEGKDDLSLVEDGKDGRDVKHKKKKIKKKGATLDAKSIGNLLEMMRNRDAKKKKSRKSLLGRRRGPFWRWRHR